MDINKTGNKPSESGNEKKILLINLPFWSPLIPAQGIASLKSFLRQYGYRVRTVDAAADDIFLDIYDDYFEVLKEIVPPLNRGNFYNIGHDVLRNHMMAHINYVDEAEYKELVKDLVHKTYYCNVEELRLTKLEELLDELFSRIAAFCLDLLEEEKPAVLGLSVNSGNLAASIFVFQLTREKYPRIRTVMGGPVFFNHMAPGNPDLEFFLGKTKSYIDKVFIGKGEILFLKYLEGQLPESQRVYTLEDLDEKDPGSYTFDVPDQSDYNLQKYFYLAASTSSSCPHQCSFCNSRTFFGEYRKKKPKQVVKEILKLQERYGHKLFFMTDSLVNPTITGVARELIEADVTAYMDCYLRVDEPSGKIENTMLWRRGGLYRVRIGTESGSQRVLDLIGKNITPAMIRESLYSLAFAGIKTTTYWVIGHPGETEKDFRQTLDLIEKSKNDIWQAECNPFTYYYVGQTHSDNWASQRKLLFPEKARDMLISQTWVLDCEPSREEIYHRVYRFNQHCQLLGIPNPYSANELYQADERWKKLHKNAVPTIFDVAGNKITGHESEKIKQVIALKKQEQEIGDFDF